MNEPLPATRSAPAGTPVARPLARGRGPLLLTAIAAVALLAHLDVAVALWDRLGVRVTRPTDAAPDVERLLGRMTLEEKVEQLHGVGQMRGTVNRRLDVPALQSADGPHGVGEAVWRYLYRHTDRATAFPAAIAVAASWSPELAGRVAAAIAREARAKGRNWLLAPAVDLVRDPRAGRVFETFGEDPHLSARLGVAHVRGAQQQGVIATPKHFVCHHHETDRKHIDVEVGERALRELYLPPFEAAVREGGALAVMAASHRVNGIQMTEHPRLLREVLREEWGFDGVVVSDWKSATSTVASIEAGLDVEMPKALHYGRPLVEAVESGRVAASRVDEAARRVLRVKLAAGLFTRPAELDGRAVGAPEHRRLALEAAREGAVLLSNRGLLPLELPPGATVAVVGPFAGRPVLGGRGSSEVRPLRPISLVEGLRSTLPRAVRLRTVADWRDARRVREAAAGADAVVLAVGLGPAHEGEALDRVGNGLDLPAEQLRLIEEVTTVTPHAVVVLSAGSAIAMDPWIERVGAVLHAWYAGELGGVAVAELLLGLENPSGKLPITLPRSPSQLPAFATFPERDTAYREGVFVGYRHFDAAGLEPLFPFGHGLSYTAFEYSGLRVRARGRGESTRIRVRFSIRNTGARAGAEVAQLYLSDLGSSVPRPPRELKGFAKVRLAPDETRELELRLDWRDLALFDERSGAWIVEPGRFLIEVGASSRDLRLRQRFRYRP